MNRFAAGNSAQGEILSEEKSFEDALREALSFLRRSLVLMLGVGLLFAAVTLVITSKMERVYKSTAQLMIERSVISPIEVDQLSSQRADNGYVGGQVLLLSSSDTLLKVIERADLLNEPAFQATPLNPVRKAINWIKPLILGQNTPPVELPDGSPDMATLKALSILKDAVLAEREGDTNVVTIDVRAPSSALAHRIAATLAGTYIDLRLDAREQEALRLSDWIDARSDELRAKLTRAERAVTTFRIDNNLIGDSNTASLSDQKLTEINAELIRARADLAQKRASYQRFQEVLAGNGDLTSLPEVQGSPIVSALRESLLELERREQEATQIGSANNPRMVQLQRQLALVEKQLNEEVLRAAQVLSNETESLENRTRILATALEKAGGQSGLETQSAVELRELQRVADAYRMRYERYLNNAGMAIELSTFATSGTQVVSAPSLPLLPVYPPTKVLVVLSFMLGIGLAMIIQLVRETLSGQFASVAELEQTLGFRVLAVLPRLQPGTNWRDLVNSKPFSPFSEAISVLRQNLRLRAQKSNDDTGAPVILVTSAGESAGKTSIAVALAVSAGSGGQRVLMVDADLRYAGLSELYDVDDGEGLCDILRGRAWLPDDAPIENGLDIIPAGDLMGRQPADCLATPHLGKFLNRARQNYDLVVVDGPPVANLADCKILAEDCTQIVVVLHFGQTTKDDMRGALKQLPSSKIAGIVVNQVDAKATSAQWYMGGAASVSYVQTAQLYQLRNAAIERDRPSKRRPIGRIA